MKTIREQQNYRLVLLCFLLTFLNITSKATDITDASFLITRITPQNLHNQNLWEFLGENNETGIELEIETIAQNPYLKNSRTEFRTILKRIETLVTVSPSKIIPVFLKFDGNVLLLDSIIKSAEISSSIFYLPQGEAWPSLEYLVQANRRVVFFVDGNYGNKSRILHNLDDYVLKISATPAISDIAPLTGNTNVNLELFMVNDFERLPTQLPQNSQSRNLVPDYVNFLLESWKKYGKKPNFIFVGNNIFNFDFIIDQLNSFTWIKGQVKTLGKNLEKVYWKNPDILFTGGKFSFPFRGGEELILTPFAPGHKMTPEQIIVTGEMAVPENYSILALPLELGYGMTGKFQLNGMITNELEINKVFSGENYSFSEDIERGYVLRLPENASVNLGDPENYGLRNSSFTVSCFVKFTEILEFGDNAILGNYESGYRRGLHLILRSGHPYFGLWANDFISERLLDPNIWYHIAWRYILETGEQAIFLDGEFIGGSDGHPPFSGTGDIHLGSALSSGASLRGYIDNLYVWDRPLGIEEINRLALDESIAPLADDKLSPAKAVTTKKWAMVLVALIFAAIAMVVFFIFSRKKKQVTSYDLPPPVTENQIQLFGEFKAIDKHGNDITERFTPKVKELFLYVLIYSLKSRVGANVSEVNDVLWPGIPSKKVANNRSVTLNKLRKILAHIDGVEIVSHSAHLQTKLKKPFTCDFAKALKLCEIPEGMNKQQLIAFFEMVKRGRFLKGTDWHWLDEIRGFTGNQVIDNLLKLASLYKKEGDLKAIEKVAQRILEYDELNEDATYLQIWAHQQAKNSNLAKFNFNSFQKKYKESLNEPYPLDYESFQRNFEEKI